MSLPATLATGSPSGQLPRQFAEVGPGQPPATKAIPDIDNTEGKEHATKSVAEFTMVEDGTKLPKAVKKIVVDETELVTFHGFPAMHWIHLRTRSPVE